MFLRLPTEQKHGNNLVTDCMGTSSCRLICSMYFHYVDDSPFGGQAFLDMCQSRVLDLPKLRFSCRPPFETSLERTQTGEVACFKGGLAVEFSLTTLPKTVPSRKKTMTSCKCILGRLQSTNGPAAQNMSILGAYGHSLLWIGVAIPGQLDWPIASSMPMAT